MLGTNSIQVTPALMQGACAVDEFKGYWRAMEKHTTGLNLLSEFAKHGRGFRSVLEQLKDHPISAGNIKKLYAAMVLKEKTAAFKTEENKITFKDKNGQLIGTLETAPPEQVEVLMEKLAEWVNNALERKQLHPLFVIAIFNAIFLQIGPFQHSNQRLCNILTQILMFKAGYSYAPYILLEDIIMNRAGVVYTALKANQQSLEDGRPQWNGWLETFLGVFYEHKMALEKKLNAEGKDLSHLPTLSARVMDLFESHNRLQMNEIIKMTGGRRATIKLRLKELTEQGYLNRYGQARSTWYSLN